MMKTQFDSQAEKQLLEQALEEHLKQLYEMLTSMRSADLEKPASAKSVVKTWCQIHRHHQRLQKQFKTLIYETQFPFFKPGALKKAPRRT